MKNTINEIKKLLYVALANAPEECQCTTLANGVFEKMNELRDAIEMLENSGEKIRNDEKAETETEDSEVMIESVVEDDLLDDEDEWDGLEAELRLLTMYLGDKT